MGAGFPVSPTALSTPGWVPGSTDAFPHPQAMPHTGSSCSPGHGGRRRGFRAPYSALHPGQRCCPNQVPGAREDRARLSGANGFQRLHHLCLGAGLPVGEPLHPAQPHSPRGSPTPPQQQCSPAAAAWFPPALQHHHLPRPLPQQLLERGDLRDGALGRLTQTAQEDVFPTDAPVPLSALNGSSHYLVWVQASNALGTARSAPQHLDLQQLVVPAVPLAERAETTAGSPPTTTIHWRQQTELQDVRCEERHKAVGAAEWQVTAWDSAVQRGHQLQSATSYVFQARCRLSAAGSPWSAWGLPFIYSTPEAAPAAAPDVWRRLGRQFPNGSHEVTVLIKPPRGARTPILGYAVWAGASRPLCNTSSAACSLLLPPALLDLRVTAYNARGASSPARVPLRRDPSPEAFPPPLAVDVQHKNQSTILVAWQPPRHSRTPPLWFIVEWLCTAPYSHEEEFFWKKVPGQDTHTYIREDAAAGSHISVSVYAAYPDGVSKPSSGQVSSEDRMLDIIYQEASHDDDIRFFLGMGVSVIILSVVLVILMLKKSARKRTKAAVALVLPKWLLEDFPHMENSRVIKSFQEKSEFTSSIFSGPVPDNSDPTITEIQELSGHKKYRNVDIKKEPSSVVPENVEHPQSSAPPHSTATEQVGDYKPQISDANTLGYVAANIGLIQPYTPAPEPETSIFFRDYSSPFSYLWDAQGAEGPQICLLDKINLVLNNDRSGQNHAFSSAQEEQNALLENQWEKTLYSEGAQEQTLVPDELVSCLRATNGGSVDIQTCFPQSIGRLF
ncbi:interleukin-23 receptor isoform X1 [Tympanuchus pallidicinctus]|uniref:interleukin-23 receptor isoform X1 n=1 Tax=Tympanuchus pallidicinctus TaxID=109042 RepID=UPI0022872D59|nr:interleukin-23 receptor isoform X1 [Tympanuchus pallidicinctus]XP_052522822.1 interleukin-23 receptor isoform X1 [Tympanuchus pallidicinctus]